LWIAIFQFSVASLQTAEAFFLKLLHRALLLAARLARASPLISVCFLSLRSKPLKHFS
jgi:hypothetical protein